MRYREEGREGVEVGLVVRSWEDGILVKICKEGRSDLRGYLGKGILGKECFIDFIVWTGVVLRGGLK